VFTDSGNHRMFRYALRRENFVKKWRLTLLAQALHCQQAMASGQTAESWRKPWDAFGKVGIFPLDLAKAMEFS
jgi:hypothetical protein